MQDFEGIHLHSGWSELFPESSPIERGGGGAESADATEVRVNWEEVPAKGAVYLLVAEEEGVEKPMLLATVGDLRAALKRRLLELPSDVKSKRVAYGKVCTRVYWRRVDSSFAANWWYWRAARELFPQTYAAMVPWRASWWIGVEREGVFPRLRKTTDLREGALMYAGPVRDKHAAARLIETVEDLFDLCRYYSVLVQAPHGKACAYKEMGKCPAPCDGSVPVPWYREQMDRAWAFLTREGREAWQADTEKLMRDAAEKQEFETAAKIKQRLARAGAIEGRAGEAYAKVRALQAFSFVAIEPGKGKPWIEPWLVHGGKVECLAQVQKKELAAGAEEIVARYRAMASQKVQAPIDTAGVEQIAMASQHLFRGEDDHGIYLRGEDVLERGAAAVSEAAEKLWARKAAPKPMVEQSSEGEILRGSTEAE